MAGADKKFRSKDLMDPQKNAKKEHIDKEPQVWNESDRTKAVLCLLCTDEYRYDDLKMWQKESSLLEMDK